MATMKLTLIGIESYFNANNKSVFDDLNLPTGYTKEDVVNNILMICGEFETLYADADYLKAAISLWGRKWYHTFDRWLTALNTEYNALENYDRIEEWHDDAKSTGTTKLNTSGTNGDTTENKVSAYDSSDYSPNALNSTNGHNNQDSEGNSTGTTVTDRTGRTHGNIGVTTSQAMLEAELNIAKWNLLNHIADVFKQEFCIAVYE